MEAITVVNKSGKVVSTSKHLIDVFKEARSAYLEKKAELKAVREGRDPDLQRKAIKNAGEERRRSPASDRQRSPRRHDSKKSSRPRSRSRDSTDSRRRDSKPYESRRSENRRHERTRSEERYDSRRSDNRYRDSRREDDRHRESRRDGDRNRDSRREDDRYHGSRRSDPRRHDSRRDDTRRYDSRYEESRSHDSRRQDSSRKYRKPSLDRGYSDSIYETERAHSEEGVRRSSTQPNEPSRLRRSQEPGDKGSLSDREAHTSRELTRRHSDSESQAIKHPAVPVVASGYSSEEVDMELAYGELPPPLPLRQGHTAEEEIRNKMTTLTRLLEEANCLHYSAKAVAASLENNPEAMAAVGLTLAEISNLARKIGPGALTALRGAFPAIIAILASPEFLIAGGVALGVTVVAFGGYKIIKKIKAKKENGEETSADELEEIQSDVDRIKVWRRGLEPAEGITDNESVATSVDAEFVTPMAGRQLRDEGVMAPSSASKRKDDKSTKEDKKKEKEMIEKEKKDAKKEKKEKEKREKQEKAEQAKKEKEDKDKDKTKEPSALALLFKKDQVVP